MKGLSLLLLLLLLLLLSYNEMDRPLAKPRSLNVSEALSHPPCWYPFLLLEGILPAHQLSSQISWFQPDPNSVPD